MKQGKVYLVGAGPGDPGLITVKGQECLRRADVVIYDRLVDDSLLQLAPPDAERIYVGKAAQRHAREQQEIDRLLVSKAREGRVVVRLKGGDPFVLGRGGEEAEALARHRVPFEVVPGVSSAVAVPAYAGIPLTHRRLASCFAVVTGHESPGKGRSRVNWEGLARGADTLVFLMGMANLAQIVKQLLKNGRPPATPVALIHQGTTPQQETVIGSLEDIVARAEGHGLQPPAVIVVGPVVQLRDRLRWFDNHPLFGKRILVTRTRGQASALSRLLTEHGAQPIELPTIEIRPAATGELDRAILGLGDYHWIIFTSVNGVVAFLRRLHVLNRDSRWLGGLRLGAIGPATARALQEQGLRPDVLPEEHSSAGLIAALKGWELRGCRVLLPRADIATGELARGLADLGAEVQEVTAYHTLLPTEASLRAKEMLLAAEVDIVTFTSSSTVTNLLALLGGQREAINRAKVACIGPRTAATATEAGLRVDILSQQHTIPGLVQAMEHYFQKESP